ncbi:hypothetical protein ISN44_As12g034390, partial [Arabidopsis suecica]
APHFLQSDDPFYTFFTETLYQNLRKACEGSEESIHYCSFPEEAEGTRVERIEQSVTRMMTIIDLARNIRERHKLPLKTPLKEITVVHPDAEFLDDITGKLKEYVLEELNVRSLVPCNDTLKYASLKAEPDFSVLGKRLGKSMRLVAKEVKEMSQQDILRFEETGKVTIAGHTLELTDIKIVRVFKRPDGLKDTEIDANGDGDVLVILNLQPDDSLYEAGVAREIVNRIQKLRKKSVLCSQEQYIKDTIGSSLLPSTLMPSHAVILSDESFQNVSKLSFKISLARPALKFNEDAILALFSGDEKFARGLQAYLLSRDQSNLKSEFQQGNGKIITVSCIEKLPVVSVVLGDHLHLTVGDYLLSTSNS